MFVKSAAWYDAICAWKDYPREADRLHALIGKHARRPRPRCSTWPAEPASTFPISKRTTRSKDSTSTRRCWRSRGSGVRTSCSIGNMVNFDLHRQYDVVACLFSSIAYAKSQSELQQALASMHRHVGPGGLVIVEPFIRPERFEPGHVSAIFVDRPGLKIARINVGTVENGIAILPFHYLVGTPEGVQYFTERHELALFSHDEYLAAFRAPGLEVMYDEEGLTGRGLYIGVRDLV